jgi:hypothetical protein
VPESDHLALLKAAYEDARGENERLRDARRGVTRQLGPLPISASIVAGLVAGFGSESIQCEALLWVALGLLGVVLIPLSMLYSNMRPYRALREEKEKDLEEDKRPSTIAKRLQTGLDKTDRLVLVGGRVVRQRQVDAQEELIQWYESMIWLERSIYGGGERPGGSNWRTPRVRTPISSMVEGFERERSGLIAVQIVFGVVILLLVLSRLV